MAWWYTVLVDSPYVTSAVNPRAGVGRAPGHHARRFVLGCLLVALAMLVAGLPLAQAQSPLTVAVGKTDGSNFPAVTAFVTLVDASGRPVLGVGPSGWELLEDGKPVKALSVGSVVNAQEPLNVVLAVDTSGSMAGRAIEDAKAAAVTFVQNLGGADKAAVISFADQPTVVQPLTSNRDELARAISGLRAAGETALYDGLLAAAQLVAGQQSGRRVVILLSDGEDTASKTKAEVAIAGVQQAGAPVFTVGLGNQIDRNALNGLAVGTGGVALYAPSSADLRQTYANIADQLRNQYALTFVSSLPADNARHALLVRARVGSAQAEAHAVFVATSVPPEITIVTPSANQAVSGKVPVEVTVKAAGAVKKVEATAAGRTVGAVEAEPYRFEWDTSDLAPGNHLLDITVHDALGNRATKQVTVTVQAPPAPTPMPTATPVPTPVPTPAPSGPGQELLLGGAGAFAALALAVVVVRRSRRPKRLPPAWQRMPKDRPISHCPTCGAPLKRGQECPECRAKDEETIRQRLRELGDHGQASAGDTEGRR